ncbi:hypothetical protein GCM10009784_07350 [Arthrobacter parietis]|uniref:Uncharacterized protein n=1 Tax=Arthrobacter parietis TaxID=271434 RepID=A0ABN3AQ80_9MICC
MPACNQQQVFTDGKGREEQVLVEDGGHLPAEGNGVGICQHSVDFHFPRNRELPAGKRACRRRLPRPIESDDAEYLPGADCHRHLTADRRTGVADNEALGLQDSPP